MSTSVVITAQARQMSQTGSGRLAREMARLSLSAVADEIGVAKSTLSRWERGQRKPSGAGAERWVTLLQQLREAI